MLHTRWSQEAWSVVRVEFRQVLARRSDVLHDRHGALADERERALESRDCEMIRGPAKSVLEPEESPAGIFTPRHLGLVLPREDSYPAQKRQATGHFAARVDPYRAIDDLHVADCHPCA